MLQTSSGDFVIDSASGGVIKLIEITWQIYTFSLSNPSFVVTMDEPENHLHPSMQKSFLANLVEAFKDVQFIVVTHSPFVVSSVRESNVYVLRYDDLEIVDYDNFGNSELIEVPGPSSRVYSELLDTVNKAGTASEILRDALGVPTTIPNWVDERLDEIMLGYRGRVVTEQLLQEMYTRFESEGLVSEYPKSISQLRRSA